MRSKKPGAADPASSDPRFSIGPRGTSPGGLSGPPWRPQGGQPASIMSTRAPATGPVARGEELPVFFEWVAEAQRARIISISGVRPERARGGSAGGGCVALLQASICAARPWAQPLKLVSNTKSGDYRYFG